MELEKIEEALGFKLTEQQKRFILEDDFHYDKSDRQSGFTTAYIIKFLTNDIEKPVIYRYLLNGYYLDELHDRFYRDWFVRYFSEIYSKLMLSGVKIKILDFSYQE